MPLIQNERIKLTATWLNTLSAATIVTGVIAPLAAIVFGLPASGTLSMATFLFAAVAWLLWGLILHLAARYGLRRLQE
jgi:dipeptide/tripeptide permease